VFLFPYSPCSLLFSSSSSPHFSAYSFLPLSFTLN
jgi:hypothetical protein